MAAPSVRGASRAVTWSKTTAESAGDAPRRTAWPCRTWSRADWSGSAWSRSVSLHAAWGWVIAPANLTSDHPPLSYDETHDEPRLGRPARHTPTPATATPVRAEPAPHVPGPHAPAPEAPGSDRLTSDVLASYSSSSDAPTLHAHTSHALTSRPGTSHTLALDAPGPASWSGSLDSAPVTTGSDGPAGASDPSSSGRPTTPPPPAARSAATSSTEVSRSRAPRPPVEAARPAILRHTTRPVAVTPAHREPATPLIGRSPRPESPTQPRRWRTPPGHGWSRTLAWRGRRGWGARLASALPTPARTPFTFCYAVVLLATGLFVLLGDLGAVNGALEDSSSDASNLAHRPPLALVTSGIWVAGGLTSPSIVLFPFVLGALERRVGAWRTAAVFALGHVLATLFTELPVAASVASGHLPPSSLDRLDYGSAMGCWRVWRRWLASSCHGFGGWSW